MNDEKMPFLPDWFDLPTDQFILAVAVGLLTGGSIAFLLLALLLSLLLI